MKRVSTFRERYRLLPQGNIQAPNFLPQGRDADTGSLTKGKFLPQGRDADADTGSLMKGGFTKRKKDEGRGKERFLHVEHKSYEMTT